jgi:hypothetical protein
MLDLKMLGLFAGVPVAAKGNQLGPVGKNIFLCHCEFHIIHPYCSFDFKVP